VRELPPRQLNPGSPFPVIGSITELFDRQTNEPIAQCYVFGYSPLISRVIFYQLVHWRHRPTCLGGGFFDLVTATIQPLSSNQN
jgi:hypothetical protein